MFRPQHLSGLQLISELCRGKLIGGAIGQTEIVLQPAALENGHYVADTKTAG